MTKHPHHVLNQFYATSIAGNDILSSALYVSGIAAIFAGIYAPLVLLAVACVLFFYKSVYQEVVGALPVNGGAYNALLNGTSKRFAAIAGVMTVLSYVATGVISAKTAIEYLFFFLQRYIPTFTIADHTFILSSLVIPTVIGVLLFFALLVIAGVKDSAKVAASIFVFHIFTLASFAIFGLIFIATHGMTIWGANVSATHSIVAAHGGLLKTLFLAFSASLLGVSGFESSANFVEEQGKGVFPKTLRNMAVGVLVFNPLLAYVALNILSLDRVALVKDFLLADAAVQIGGILLLAWIAVDAFFVLCGAVLTAYIGVAGLVNRMALDGCLPARLTVVNSKGSHPRIIIAFFFLCTSILVITQGDLLALAGVYTISFLSVMTFFAASNLILRISRPDLKRPYRAPLAFVFIALISTFIGVMGNISIDPQNTGYFLTYFIPSVALVFGVMERKRFAAMMAKLTKLIPPFRRYFLRRLKMASGEKIIAFVHHVDRLAVILDYIRKNETSEHVTLVHCSHREHTHRTQELKDILTSLKNGGFYPTFTINVEYIDKPFVPETVMQFAQHKHVPLNKVFIGSIHHFHDFNYEDLGGVRVIL